MLLFSILGLILSSHGALVRRINYTSTVDSNPTLYLALVSENIKFGLEKYVISTQQSMAMTTSFFHKTITENKNRVGLEASASGIVEVFDIAGKVESEIIHNTYEETKEEITTAKSWSESITGTYNVEDDEIFYTAAEMKLYVFIDDKGVQRRLSLPTGKLQTGAFGKKNLENQILDQSFELLIRSSGWKIPTYTKSEIESQIASKCELPRLLPPIVIPR